MSKLDPNIYGDQNSKITEDDIKYGLEGLTVDEVILISLFFFSNKISRWMGLGGAPEHLN